MADTLVSYCQSRSSELYQTGITKHSNGVDVNRCRSLVKFIIELTPAGDEAVMEHEAEDEHGPGPAVAAAPEKEI